MSPGTSAPSRSQCYPATAGKPRLPLRPVCRQGRGRPWHCIVNSVQPSPAWKSWGEQGYVPLSVAPTAPSNPALPEETPSYPVPLPFEVFLSGMIRNDFLEFRASQSEGLPSSLLHHHGSRWEPRYDWSPARPLPADLGGQNQHTFGWHLLIRSNVAPKRAEIGTGWGQTVSPSSCIKNRSTYSI